MSVLHVLFQVAGVDYVLPAQDVLFMETYSGATPVPGSVDYVAGLVQFRQQVLPAVDMRRRFHLPPTPPSQDTRVIVVKHAGRSIGLIVDSAREMLRISGDDFKEPPDVVRDQTSGFIRSIAQAGSRIVMLINFAKVIDDVSEESAHAD